MERKRSISIQIKKQIERRESMLQKKEKTRHVISTGSTLLDLAISGGNFPEGGLPFGIIVEVFGDSATGKTVLLTELAGRLQKMGGKVLFHDPEARLNKQFARMFNLDVDEIEYTQPDTVTEVFKQIRKWDVLKQEGEQFGGIFTDSLAALSTDMEMDNEDGDKMGMRRAREFSEELRKTARILAKKNVIMIASNQIRESPSQFGSKISVPGGKAFKFYASVRLYSKLVSKITKEIKVGKKIEKHVIGVNLEMEVVKNSVDAPFRKAPVSIVFDYGIDDIRANLQFVKECMMETSYTVGDVRLGVSLEKAIQRVEERGLEKQLQQQVITLWKEQQEQIRSHRKKY